MATASVGSKFGPKDPEKFAIRTSGAESADHLRTDGNVFLISSDGKSHTMQQLNLAPESASEKDILRRAKQVVERDADSE